MKTSYGNTLSQSLFSFLDNNRGAYCDRQTLTDFLWPQEPKTKSALTNLVERLNAELDVTAHKDRVVHVSRFGYRLESKAIATCPVSYPQKLQRV